VSTNFLWYTGVSSNSGLVVAAVSVMTTELDSLASAAVAGSTVNGTSGVFVNTFFGQAIWADLYFSVGSPALTGTLAVGANVCGWFLTSPDGGTTYESTSVAPPRPPDFIIPMPAATSLAASSFFKTAGPVMLPSLDFKVLVQNNTGQALSTGGTTAPYIKVAPYAMQY
jgi:hypothetical protein